MSGSFGFRLLSWGCETLPAHVLTSPQKAPSVEGTPAAPGICAARKGSSLWLHSQPQDPQAHLIVIFEGKILLLTIIT